MAPSSNDLAIGGMLNTSYPTIASYLGNLTKWSSMFNLSLYTIFVDLSRLLSYFKEHYQITSLLISSQYSIKSATKLVLLGYL